MAILYRTIGKGFLFPLHRHLWRVEIEGAEHIPAGAAVLAPNHDSLLDPFFLGLATRRIVHYMAKAELWELKFVPGLGTVLEGFAAFPVRRGESDGGAGRDVLGALDLDPPEVAVQREQEALADGAVEDRHGVRRC